LSSVSCFLLSRRHPKTTAQDDTVISTEAAHAFVSRAMEKSASLPRLPPEPSPRLHLFAFLVLIPPKKIRRRLPKPQPTQTTRPKPCSPSVTIHHLPLDANPSTFYSLRIFDTLAPLANSIAVTKRTLCAATNPRPHLIQSPESFCSAVNPVPPDGGQHTT
jgi:hypothetical protein